MKILSGILVLLGSLSLLQGQNESLKLQAQPLAVFRMACATSVWSGVRPVRRNISAGRGMQCWSQEDALSYSKTWKGRILERVRLKTPQTLGFAIKL